MSTFWRLLGFLRPYRKGVIWSFLLAFGALGATVLIPWLTGLAINAVNMPALTAEQFRTLGPYGLLAERLGSSGNQGTLLLVEQDSQLGNHSVRLQAQRPMHASPMHAARIAASSTAARGQDPARLTGSLRARTTTGRSG